MIQATFPVLVAMMVIAVTSILFFWNQTREPKKVGIDASTMTDPCHLYHAPPPPPPDPSAQPKALPMAPSNWFDMPSWQQDLYERPKAPPKAPPIWAQVQPPPNPTAVGTAKVVANHEVPEAVDHSNVPWKAPPKVPPFEKKGLTEVYVTQHGDCAHVSAKCPTLTRSTLIKKSICKVCGQGTRAGP